MTTANDSIIHDTSGRIDISVSFLTYEGVSTPYVTIENTRHDDMMQFSMTPEALKALGNRCLGIAELCSMEDLDA
jgi:hypothetical protein